MKKCLQDLIRIIQYDPEFIETWCKRLHQNKRTWNSLFGHSNGFKADWAFELEADLTENYTYYPQIQNEIENFRLSMIQDIDMGIDGHLEMPELRLRFRGSSIQSFLDLKMLCENYFVKWFLPHKNGSVHAHAGISYSRYMEIHCQICKRTDGTYFMWGQITDDVIGKLNPLSTYEYRGGWSDIRYTNIVSAVLVALVCARELSKPDPRREFLTEIVHFIEEGRLPMPEEFRP